MKNLKRPTFAQKKRIVKAGLDFEDYLIQKDTPEELIIVSKETNEVRSVKGKVSEVIS